MLKNRKGTALITGVIVLMMVAMLGMAYVTLTGTNLMRANRDERRNTAFYLAEAGIEYIIAQLMEQSETNGGVVTAQTHNTTSLLNSLRNGVTNGSVVVTPDTGTSAVITSSATFRGVTEKIRVRLILKNIGVWNNAIFAGIGSSGKGINGNVDIRGSVHILGEGDPYTDLNGNGQRDLAETYTDSNGNGQYDSGEPFTDTDHNGVWSALEPYQDNNLNGIYDDPLTATEMATDISGSALIGNNYSGIPADLQAKIPALPLVSYGGESVQDLNAELRVKHGKVNISGSANVGDPNATGNLYKETVAGTFVTDGYGGNKGASSVYSDNGTSQRYDLGDRIPFPSLLDEHTDPITGTVYDTYHDYLVANSAEISGVTTITSSTASFTKGSGSNTISWNKATSTLTINGIVRIPNNLHLSSKGSTIYFAGEGTIYTPGNSVYVHGNVMPKTMFPTTDSMGVIAGLDIEFATGSGESQLRSAGAWYAQRKIKSAKQNQFAGTYVSNYFDMGSNVPNIYQVPTLASNLPPGMPGGDNAAVTQVLSWERLSQSE